MAAGATVDIVHYDSAAVGVDTEEVLGLTSTTNLPGDVKEQFADLADSLWSWLPLAYAGFGGLPMYST
ncbi:hypothetical protein ZWY2020_018248 [Hordeum vulgare]|nr:hypothetical protein ZWY2020_018248 [Hordeum vulgare]